MKSVLLRDKLASFSEHRSLKIVGKAGKNSLGTLLPLCALLSTNACNPKQGATYSQVEHCGNSQRITIGMPLEDAVAILKSHHANETGIQVVSTDPNNRLRFFNLPNGRTLEIVSNADSDSRQTIKGISISTYQPKSWTNKQDSERSRFLESFRKLHHYDMVNQSTD